LNIDLFNLPSGTTCLREGFLHFTNKEKKDSIIVVFSSFAAKDYGPTAFSYLKHFAAAHDTCDLLFLKDPRNQWYNRGFAGLGKNVEECAAALTEILARYSRSVTFGSSMGAYASLLFGNRCKVTTAIALAPQTFLAPPFPRFNGKLHGGSYIDLALEIDSPGTENLVIIGEEELFDIYQLARLPQRPQLRRLSVPGSHHNVVKFLDDRGLLSKLVEDLAAERLADFCQDLAPLTAGSRIDWASDCGASAGLQSQVAEALEAFYNSRLEEARHTLETLLETNPGWMGLLLVLAEVYYRQSEPERALDCLLQVQKSSGFLDGYEGLMAACRSKIDSSMTATPTPDTP
jgi:hypothetical protein